MNPPKCCRSRCENIARYYGSNAGFGKLCDEHSNHKAKQCRESRANLNLSLKEHLAREMYNVFYGYYNEVINTKLPNTTKDRYFRLVDWLLENFQEKPKRNKRGKFIKTTQPKEKSK